MPVFRYLFFFSLEIGAGGDIEEDGADAEGHAAIENEGTDTGGVINQRGKEYDKEVAQSAGEQPEAGNDALEVLAGGGVGIFKTRGAHQDFRKGEQEVGDTLPEDAEAKPGVNEVLQRGYCRIGDACHEDAQTHALERGAPASDVGVDVERDQRHKNHDEQRVEALHFLGAEAELDVAAAQVDALHFLALQYPGGGGLVIQAPEGDNQEEYDEHARQIAYAALFAFGEAEAGFFLAVEYHAARQPQKAFHAGGGCEFEPRQRQHNDVEQEGHHAAERGDCFAGSAQGGNLEGSAMSPVAQQHHNGSNDDEDGNTDGCAGGAGYRFAAKAFAGAFSTAEDAGEEGFQEFRLGGGNVVIFLASEPEDKGGYGHEDTRNAECPAVAPVLSYPGDHEEGEEGAQVDGPVEGGVKAGERGAVLFAGGNLVAHEGRNAGFDATRTYCNDGKTDKENPFAGFDIACKIGERQYGIAQAVEQRDGKDGAVATQETVCQPGSEQGEQVGAGNKEVNDFRGLVLRHEEHPRHVCDEDAPHSIEAEAFAGLIAYDVFGLSRQGHDATKW